MYKIIMPFVASLLLTDMAFSAVLKGKVIDVSTSDVLVGAVVYIEELKMGTTSKQDGSYVF